jgi:hypothetical protein
VLFFEVLATAGSLGILHSAVNLSDRQRQAYGFEAQLIVELGQHLPIPAVASPAAEHLDLHSDLGNDHVLFQTLHLLIG